MVELGAILEWVVTVQKVRGILASSLSDQLQRLGDLEYSAAIRAFREMSISSEPRGEWIMGLTLLRDAFGKFVAASQVSKTRRTLDMMLSVYTLNLRTPPYERAGERAVITALTIAVAYHIDGNASLVRDWASQTMSSFDSYRDRYVEARYREGAGSGNIGAAEERRTRVENEMSKLRHDLADICRTLGA
jgi:hypothetical protein